jgi:hypothetical protein
MDSSRRQRQINLTTGEGSFDVEGLVLNGGNASGTPGAVSSVIGTLVCNAGSPAGSVEAAIFTPATSLSAAGDAELSFRIGVPSACNNPLFLIRVAPGLDRDSHKAWHEPEFPVLDWASGEAERGFPAERREKGRSPCPLLSTHWPGAGGVLQVAVGRP